MEISCNSSFCLSMYVTVAVQSKEFRMLHNIMLYYRDIINTGKRSSRQVFFSKVLLYSRDVELNHLSETF